MAGQGRAEAGKGRRGARQGRAVGVQGCTCMDILSILLVLVSIFNLILTSAIINHLNLKIDFINFN